MQNNPRATETRTPLYAPPGAAAGDQGVVLVVQAHTERAHWLLDVLHSAGFITRWCASPQIAMAAFHQSSPDLVVLAAEPGSPSGLQLCRQMRRESEVPIMMVARRASTGALVEAFAVGADDYLAEPFPPAEFLARAHARLARRMHSPAGPRVVKFHDLEIDVDARRVRRGTTSIRLTPTEFALFGTLIGHPGRAFTRAELLRTVWGRSHNGDERMVTVNMQRLRSKIEIDASRPRILMTVRGYGYRLGDELDLPPSQPDSSRSSD
jgi:two-component system response regulator MtrA